MRLPYGASSSFANGLLTDGITSLLRGWHTREKRVCAVLVVLLLMNFRVFEYFPGFRPLQDGWYLLTFFVFVIAYPLLKIQLDWTFTRVELYFLACLPILLFLPAITSHYIFGQPFSYGIPPQRSSLLVMWWLLLLNAWKLGWVDEKEIEKSLLFVAWATFILFNLMRLVLNPNNYPEPGFTVGPTFTFSSDFAIFAVFYYSFRGLRQQRPIFYLLAVAQFVSSIGHSGRSLIVAVLAVLLFFLFRIRGFIRAVPFLVLAGALILSALGTAFFLAPTATSERLGKFADAFRVVAGSSEVQDISANARIYESDTAKQYIAQYPVFGAGDVSKQWNGGLASVVGAYFVPGDIGLIGIMFKYGIFGLLFFSLQYLFCFRFFSGVPHNRTSPIIEAAKGSALFTMIYSGVAGTFVFGIESSSFFIVLLTLLQSNSGVRRPLEALAPAARFRAPELHTTSS